MRIKVGSSRSGDTAADIVDMPNIRTAKPIRISPMCFLAGSLLAMRSTIPITEITPVSVAVENRSIQPPVEPISERQMIQPVMDVPRIAPSTMEMACRTFIIPELTKPTIMTDVADEDWITAVTPAPSRKPGQPVQNQLQFITRDLLQSVPHQGHAEQKQRDAAQQRDHIRNTHA